MAMVRVSSKTDNVAGVKLPVFKQYSTGRELSENLGLGAGGRKIAVCREKFGEYLQALIKLASLQTSFVAMDEALKITNRRVNALENVTIPRIVGTINEINRELDELEREDFTRLKVVKKKKEEALKVQEKERLAEQAAAAEANEVDITMNVSNIAIMDDTGGEIMDDALTTQSTKKDKKKKSKKDKAQEAAPASALAAFDTMEDDADLIFK
jgi:V-type H+-transporting ATPase subunit D